MKFIRLTCLFLLIPVLHCFAQNTGDSITAPASTYFKMNKSRNFWMGANYRKEWETPVRVPVLNFATEKGGLTVVKRGGGKQTRSLRVADPTGREYALRSIRKFITSKTLPMDLQSDAAVDLVADGVSASYPYSALSMPVLSEAAGIPYLKSRVVYIPDDPALGEFRSDFANLLAYFEERLPDSVKKSEDTEDVLEKLKEDNDHSADQRALLRARILDMFVMDLDRHEDQWEWGKIDKEKGNLYYPIPKDRDQAFYTNQGVLPHIIQWPWLVPQLEGIKSKTKNIKRFNYAARNLDRFFLNGLNEQDWMNEVTVFLSKMTDDVIERALAQQPREIQGIHTQWLIDILKERRKYLALDVMEYYHFLSEEVEVTTSDKKEFFDISRNDDGSLGLKIYKITNEGEQSTKLFDRTFDPKDTKEVRLYGFGGDDRFVVNGNSDKIRLRMIGGDGQDHFEYKGTAGNGGVIYDSTAGNNTVTGRFKNKMSNDTIANHYEYLGYKYNQVIPFLSVGYNPDDGVYLGGWLKITHRGFRKDPYKNSHTITLNHALATQAWNFKYNAEFIGIFGRKSDLLFEADIKAPIITNFFGYGDNTVYDKQKPGKFRYYRTRFDLGDFSLLLRKNFSEKVIMTIGPTFEYYKLDPNDRRNRVRYIVQTVSHGLDPATLFARQNYIGGKFSLVADTRDNKILPRKGIVWQTTVCHLHGLNDASYKVTQLNSEFTFHLNIINKILVVADRFGGGHNFGNFEFYQAQYLGNEDNLRGFRKYRFAGRSKAYNNLDVRLVLAKFKTYLFPGALGILGFYDAGRIWADDDKSDKLLMGYGGGFWISPLKRMVLSVSLAMSEEDAMPIVGLGWKF